MRKNAKWFWPLWLATPAAVIVVGASNLGSGQRPSWLDWPLVIIFSYTFFYFALSWPLWLTRLSLGVKTVISSLVPVAALLIVAVLPLNDSGSFIRLPSAILWIAPGGHIVEGLSRLGVGSPCRLPLWGGPRRGFSPWVGALAVLADGRILVSGGLNRSGTSTQGGKLVLLQLDGSLDPSFQGEDRCFNLMDQPGQLWPQDDGRIVLSARELERYPKGPQEVLQILDAKGEVLHRVFMPLLPPGQRVAGRILGVRLESDGGFVLYGKFDDVREGYRSVVVRFSQDGIPDLSFGTPLPDLEASFLGPVTRGPDGRIFIHYPQSYEPEKPLRLFALTPEGRHDEAFQEQLGATQQAHNLFEAHAVAVQADGKLVLALKKAYREAWVVRLNADGTWDTTFEQTAIPFQANHVSVLPDGGILVAQLRSSPDMPFSGSAPIVRLTPEGAIHEAATARLKASCASEKVERPEILTVSTDGALLLHHDLSPESLKQGRRELVRLRPDGSVDSGFLPPL